MSIVAVHGPNTMFTTQAGGQALASSPVGATATKSVSNGLVYSFSFPNPGARPATDFDWTFTGPGSPAAQADRYSGTVTFTGPGAGTVICTVAAGAGPPAAGAYTITVAPTAGVPRMGERSVEGGDEDDGGYDPGEHTVAEVQDHVNSLDGDDEIRAIYDAEVAGKNRSTLVAYLESLLPFDPGEYNVEAVVEYAGNNPDELDDIIAAEREGKNRSTLLSQLEALQTT
jgi:hypothetical protein